MSPKVTRSDDPHFYDPRFQRRVIESHRPLGFIENMHDVKFECGHSPLIFCVPDPQAGETYFCPDCYDEAAERGEA